MRRTIVDRLVSAIGLVVAVVMLVGAGLLFWAHNFVDTQVHDQLVEQKIFFPPAGPALDDPLIKPYLEQYAGQQLVDGAQAEAYANHFIAVHVAEATGGKSYAELSNLARANPDDATIAAQVETSFRGETLRGLLLNAFAFWKMGQIALYAGIAALVGAVVMLLLSGLGFWHARRLDADDDHPTAETNKPVVVG